MALGTQSFSAVSTGFTSDSKAMVPVSIQGMAGKLQKMSTFDSMQEIFLEIRDGIGNLGEIFREKLSGLNSHLAFRLETLNNTMLKISNIAAKDLGLEKTQTDIDKENEKDEDKEESLSDDNEGKGLLTNSFKGGVAKVIQRVKDMSLVESLIALGAGLALLMFNFDKVAGILGSTVKFFDQQILPRIKAFGSGLGEYYTNLFDGLFGDNGFFTVIFEGFGDVKKAIEKGDGREAINAAGETLIKGTTSAISVIGTTILGAIKVVAKTVNPNADLSALDKVIQYFNDLPGNAIKKLEADQIEFDKVLEEEGKVAATGVLLRQTYDNYIANTLDIISKGFGLILGTVNEDLGKTMMNADYSAKGISSAFKVTMKNLGDSLNVMENAIAIFVNDKLDAINSFTSIFGIPAISKMPVKSIVGQNVYVNDEGMTVPMETELKDIDILGKKDNKPIDEVMRDQILGDGMYNGKKFSFEKEELSNAELDELMNNKDNNMTLKTKELKDVASESKSDSSTSIVVPNFITDNKKIDNSSNSSQSVTVTDQRVESLDSSSNALLAYFRQ